MFTRQKYIYFKDHLKNKINAYFIVLFCGIYFLVKMYWYS